MGTLGGCLLGRGGQTKMYSVQYTRTSTLRTSGNRFSSKKTGNRYIWLAGVQGVDSGHEFPQLVELFWIYWCPPVQDLTTKCNPGSLSVIHMNEEILKHHE